MWFYVAERCFHLILVVLARFTQLRLFDILVPWIVYVVLDRFILCRLLRLSKPFSLVLGCF